MKCPSCGIWNRAHFTKCFRCGADLTDAAGQSASVEAVLDADDVTDVPAQEPVQENLPQPPAGQSAEPEGFSEVDEIYSLYDNGDWEDEDDEESEAIYGMKAASPTPPPAPEEEDDEPVTVYRAPRPDSFSAAPNEEEDDEPATVCQPAAESTAEPVQETRKFAPVSPEAVDGSTRKFSPVTEHADTIVAQPAAVDAEPEVAPTQPGISHEIIHAIFTNPPAGMHPEHAPDWIDEPRPRKLMSRKRLPQPPAQEDEPETVYKQKAAKVEPRVDNVEEFRPTARLAAQKADEQGDEFTAFATAKRSLVAEVDEADPFDAAIDLPHAEKHPKAGESGADEAAEPAAEPQPTPEQPAWVQEALLNLGSEDLNQLHENTTRPHRSQPARTAARSRELPVIEEEQPTRYERPQRERAAQLSADRPAQQAQPVYPSAAPRSGLEAIARHEAGRSSSVLQQRGAQHPAQSAASHANPICEEEEFPQSPRRSAARREVPERDQTFREPAVEEQRIQRPVARPPRGQAQPQRAVRPADDQMRLHSSRTSAQAEPERKARPVTLNKSLRVENLTRMILVGVVALLLLVGIIVGAVFGIKAIVNLFKDPQTDQQQVDQQQVDTDPNAPTVTTGTVNGRPGHIITFKGSDDDIIYISNENLENSYNIPIVGGVGTLEIEDSVLIGNRYVTDDVEVTLNPVLHEAGSGKETDLAPVTFTVTPPDAYLEFLSPEGGTAETTLGTYQVKIRVETGSVVTIDGDDVSDMIAEEDNGLGSIVYNVSVDPIGENAIPVTVMKEGCKSITQNIVLTRPVMSVPIELDAATPSASSTDNVEITGKVEAGVKVTVESSIDGDVQQSDDGSFKFTAKLTNFGDNEILITATRGEESATLTHVVSYTPSYNEYVGKAYRMDYGNLINSAGKSQPYLCRGSVVEVYQQEPYTCLYNVGTEENPKYIYLQMVEGKPLEEDKEYKVYADVHADGDKDGYPYLIGRYYVEVTEE